MRESAQIPRAFTVQRNENQILANVPVYSCNCHNFAHSTFTAVSSFLPYFSSPLSPRFFSSPPIFLVVVVVGMVSFWNDSYIAFIFLFIYLLTSRNYQSPYDCSSTWRRMLHTWSFWIFHTWSTAPSQPPSSVIVIMSLSMWRNSGTYSCTVTALEAMGVLQYEATSN